MEVFILENINKLKLNKATEPNDLPLNICNAL